MPYKIENGRLVEDIGEEPELDHDNDVIGYWTLKAYHRDLRNRKEYAVLPEHLPIFEAMGTVEGGDFEVKAIECHANRDGDCSWKDCPQAKNWQSHCPYDLSEPDEPAPIYPIPKAKNETTFPYLASEQAQQIERMQKLGINTDTCTFEQSVNALLHLLESSAKNEDVWEEAYNQFAETDVYKQAAAIKKPYLYIDYLKQHYNLTRKK